MRRSTVQWLGQVPTHWNVRRLRFLLREYDSRSVDGTEKLLSVSQYTGVSPRTKSYNGDEPDTHANSLVGYKRVDPSDLVVNIMLAWNGSMGVSRYHGIVSPAYCVYRWNDGVHPWYYHYLLRSSEYKAIMRAGSRGVVDSRLRLYTDDLYRLEVPVPPIEEQAAIVRFLDAAEGRIRRYIIAKQKLIALLEEQRQAIIHQAVTGQIDVRTGHPYPSYKPSGVEWLGDVPKHWDVRRLGRLITLTVGFPFKSDGFTQSEDDIRLLRGVNIAPGALRWENVVRWPDRDMNLLVEYRLEVGDIVIGMDRPIIGSGIRVAMVAQSDVPSLLLQRVARIRVREKLRGDYALRILSSNYFANYLAPIFTGISVPHLSPEQIKGFRLALPRIAEQEAIVEHLMLRISAIDSTMERVRDEVALFFEYRTRLIADVVAGQLDVREAVAAVPEVDFVAGEGDLGDF